MRIPSGLGRLVTRCIAGGLSVRYVIEKAAASDSLTETGEVAIAFPETRPFWFGIRFVALTYVGALGFGFIMSRYYRAASATQRPSERQRNGP